MHVNSYMFCCWRTFIIYINCISVFRQTDGTTAINRCHWTRGGCQGDTFPGLWPIIFNHGGTTFCRWRAPCKSACVNRLWCESVHCVQKYSFFFFFFFYKYLYSLPFLHLFTGKLFFSTFWNEICLATI